VAIFPTVASQKTMFSHCCGAQPTRPEVGQEMFNRDAFVSTGLALCESATRSCRSALCTPGFQTGTWRGWRLSNPPSKPRLGTGKRDSRPAGNVVTVTGVCVRKENMFVHLGASLSPDKRRGCGCWQQGQQLRVPEREWRHRSLVALKRVSLKIARYRVQARPI